MNIHTILVFLHVLGGVGIFVALGIEAAGLGRLRRAAAPAEARAWMALLALPRRIGPIAMLTMLVTGIWLMVRWWGPQPWIATALAGVVAMAVVGGVVSRRGMRRIGKALSSEAAPDSAPALRSSLADSALTISLYLRIAVGVGILALMTIKPGAAVSLLILVASIAAGLVVGLRADSRRPVVTEGTLNLKEVRP